MRLHRCSCIIFAILSSPQAQAAIDADDYAVWSAVLAARSAQTEPELRILIRDAVLDPSEALKRLKFCDELTPEWKRRVEEILAGGKTAHTGSIDKNKLTIARPITLLSAAQASEWQRRRFQPRVPTDPAGHESVDPFPESHLIELSAVTFNAGKTLAMVYVSSSCGSLCGSSSWRILEKRARVWHVLDSPDCGLVH